MLKLSVIIITLNEERNIRRCLDSVKDIADEIIVVDSFSTDNTENICKEYDVQFVQQKWLGYSGQKNFADELAHNDWVFSIDADECVSEELKMSIDAIDPPNELIAFSMNRLVNYCGKWIHHSGWYPDRKIRIWNKKHAQWEGTIHEILRFSEKPHIRQLKGDLLHYTFYSQEEHQRQANHFAHLRAETLFQKRKRSNWFQRHIAPFFKFMKIYVFRLGFLDGKSGYSIAKISANAVALRYRLLQKHYQD